MHACMDDGKMVQRIIMKWGMKMGGREVEFGIDRHFKKNKNNKNKNILSIEEGRKRWWTLVSVVLPK